MGADRKGFPEPGAFEAAAQGAGDLRVTFSCDAPGQAAQGDLIHVEGSWDPSSGKATMDLVGLGVTVGLLQGDRNGLEVARSGVGLAAPAFVGVPSDQLAAAQRVDAVATYAAVLFDPATWLALLGTAATILPATSVPGGRRQVVVLDAALAGRAPGPAGQAARWLFSYWALSAIPAMVTFGAGPGAGAGASALPSSVELFHLAPGSPGGSVGAPGWVRARPSPCRGGPRR